MAKKVPVDARAKIGANVRRLRVRAGMTQEALSEKVEIAPRYLQQIEAGEFGASLAVLIRLRWALQCAWDELLSDV